MSCRKLEALFSAEAREHPAGNNIEMLAAERLLEIIGEALKVALHTDPQHVTETIEFRHAISLRNRIAHDYDGLDDELIRDAVRENIPPLTRQIEALLDQAPPLDQPPVL